MQELTMPLHTARRHKDMTLPMNGHPARTVIILEVCPVGMANLNAFGAEADELTSKQNKTRT